ncbi:MAG: hypothetical protein AAF805_09340, partial [Planctomycetota bacterium]
RWHDVAAGAAAWETTAAGVAVPRRRATHNPGHKTLPTFTDNAGREWSITIDAPTAALVRKRHDPDFLRHDLTPGKPNTFQRLADDPVLLCDVIHTLCERERKQREVDDVDFYQQVIGEAIDGAASALLEAVESFSGRRMNAAIQAFTAQEKLEMDAIEKGAELMRSPEAAAAAEKRIRAQLIPSGSATSSPDSSASEPTG